MLSRQLFNSGDMVQVADVILRHRLFITHHSHEIGFPSHSQGLGQFFANEFENLFVRELEQFWLQCTANERPQENPVGGCSLRKFAAGE